MMRLLLPLKKHSSSTPSLFKFFKIANPYSSNSRHQQFKSKRIKSMYADNESAALSLDVSDEKLDAASRDKNKLVNLSKKSILEHAARRADLFFYSMVAYYKSHLFPERGRTFLQHGMGRDTKNGINITQGCHSSFFGNFTDKKNSQYGLLNGTHFINSLNATIELPGFVNKMDDELEEKYQGRVQSLRILQDVSQGNKSPTEGMAAFFKLMENLFSNIEKGGCDTSVWSSSAIRSDVLALQRMGTFINKWKSDRQVVNDEYIEMLLRLTPEEKLLCKKNPDIRAACYERKFAVIKDEILASRSKMLGSSQIVGTKSKW